MDKMNSITTWNNYVKVHASTSVLSPELKGNLLFPSIAYGKGKSYGDAPLGNNIVLTDTWSGITHFDSQTGVLECKSGTQLGEINTAVISHGWFLQATPGTQWITVGGAIAADVHGKNHVTHGSFSHHVLEINLISADGQVKTCSPVLDPDLFWFTHGGMGLTGIISSAKLQLKKIRSTRMDVENQKIQSFDELINKFRESISEYKIAWIKRSTSSSFKSIFTQANSSNENTLRATSLETRKLFLPFRIINPVSIWLHDTMRYGKMKSQQSDSILEFLYPLDKVSNWNMAYGKNGFIQYQCVIPTSAVNALQEILAVSHKRANPFLIVLKQFGTSNSRSPLSFPIEGFTLAIDFILTKDLLSLLNDLDQIVMDNGGRVYLAKDCRLSSESFHVMYPRWNEFQEYIHKTSKGQFRSLLSDRLQLTSF